LEQGVKLSALRKLIPVAGEPKPGLAIDQQESSIGILPTFLGFAATPVYGSF
jgi:hypothetical protein